MKSPETALWISCACACVLFAGGGNEAARSANIALGILCILFGVRVFMGHGSRVTSLGLFNYACSLFVGYAGLVAARDTSFPVDQFFLTQALATSVTAQALVTLISWGSRVPLALNSRLSSSDGRWCVAAGTIILSLAALARQLSTPLTVFTEGAAFAAIVLVACGIAFRENSSLVDWNNLIVPIYMVIYTLYFHGGTGRLRLVAAACAVAIIYTARYPLRRLKWGILIGTPLALQFLAQQRLSLQEEMSSGASQGRSGLESMLFPIEVLSRIISAQDSGQIPLAWGNTFLSVPFMFLPESVRPSELGTPLGYELVKVVAPERYGTGYSVVATAFGEWVYNFGLLGLILMTPLLAWALRFLDERFEAAIQVDTLTRREVVRVATWAVLCGSVADIAWSGLHTWVARCVSRLPPLLFLYFITRPWKMNSRKRHMRAVRNLRSSSATRS